MPTVTSYKASKIEEIFDNTIVNAYLSGDDLVLVRDNGQTVNVGPVRGPQGIQGVPGAVPEAPQDTTPYVRQDADWQAAMWTGTWQPWSVYVAQGTDPADYPDGFAYSPRVANENWQFGAWVCGPFVQLDCSWAIPGTALSSVPVFTIPEELRPATNTALDFVCVVEDNMRSGYRAQGSGLVQMANPTPPALPYLNGPRGQAIQMAQGRANNQTVSKVLEYSSATVRMYFHAAYIRNTFAIPAGATVPLNVTQPFS